MAGYFTDDRSTSLSAKYAYQLSLSAKQDSSLKSLAMYLHTSGKRKLPSTAYEAAMAAFWRENAEGKESSPNSTVIPAA